MLKITKAMLSIALAFTMTLAIAPPSFADQEVAQIYVSLAGSDSAEGTIEKPLKTIQAAKKKINSLKQEGGFSGAVVNIREGIYNVGEGIALNKGDSGSEDAPITYKAYNGEDVRITSGHVLDSNKFKPVTDPKIINRLIPQAADKIRVYDLGADGITDYGELMRPMITRKGVSAILIENGYMATTAEWPNRAFAGVNKVTTEPGATYSWTMDTDRVKNWTQAKDAQVYGMPVWDWYDETFSVAFFIPETKTIAVKESHPYGFGQNALIRVQNLMEEIDVPGEWYLDRENKKLYVYPSGGDATKNDYTLCTYNTSLVTFDGADYIRFEGIKFEGTRGNGVQINAGNHNTFYDCEFRSVGNKAINMEKGARYNTVERCHIHDVGQGGVTTGGSVNDNDLIPDKNVIKNCLFERCGLIGGIGINAVDLNGVANEVIHCRFHAGEHSAIMFMGQDHYIAYNDFYDMLRHAEDAAVVYTGRTWTGVGNRIEYNYFHHCTKFGSNIASGVYLDDNAAGDYIHGNIFHNLNRSLYWHGTSHQYAGNNLSINNFFSEYSTGNLSGSSDQQLIDYSNWIREADEKGTIVSEYKTKFAGNSIKDLLDRLYGPFEGSLESEAAKRFYKKYPWLKTHISDGKALWPSDNVTKNNVVYFGDEGQNGSLDRKGTTWEYTALAAHPDANNVNENNHSFDGWPQTVTNKKNDPRITDWSQIKEVIPDFEELNPDEWGIEGEDEIFLEDFNLMSPVNGATDVDAHDATLLWSERAGGNRYRLVIATDKDFKEIVYDDIVTRNYVTLTNLRYGSRTYYWKVQAISDHYKCKENTKWNSDGVYTFRTAESENVDKYILEQTILKTRKEYDSAEEGDKPGQFAVGAKAKFLPYLERAEEIFASKTSTKKQVDRQTEKLENEYLNFSVFRNAEKINIGTLISDMSGWQGGKPSGGVVKVANAATYGYKGDKLKPNHVVKMKTKFNWTQDTGWASIGLRASAVTGTCWYNKQYAFLVKKNVVELQSWGVSTEATIFKEYTNDFFKDGVEHDVEFSALNEAAGVRIKLVVDGEEKINYLDPFSAINTTSYMQIYTTAGIEVTLSPAK